MVDTPINQKSNWPALSAALEAIAIDSELPTGAFTAIADRLRGAIESADPARIVEAAAILEQFYDDVAALSSAAVRNAARGAARDDLAASYALGKIAFAQLLAARIADKRADPGFIAQATDPRYLPYLLALGTDELSVGQLKDKVGERIETVSRKLADLRETGIVSSRKRGTQVANVLTPAARQLLASLPTVMPPTAGSAGDLPAPAVRRALEAKRERLPDHLQQAPHFASEPLLDASKRRAA